MRYEITEQDAAVQIRVLDTAGRAAILQASMRDCQEGRCRCPTDQYDRLATMHVTATDDEVTAWLQPRPGQHFDPDELRGCLDHTLAQAERQ